jgi:hypothetical protein
VEVGVGVASGPDLGVRPEVNLPGKWTFWADMFGTWTGETETYLPGPALGPVDVAQFWCTSRLSGFGSGGVMLPLPCGLSSERLLRLWSWRLWCFYDGQLYWCGVPSGIIDENGAAMVTLTLTELPGYLKKRVWDVTAPIGVFRQVEQTFIASSIASPCQQIGCPIITDPGPGYLRDRTYEYLESDSRGQLLINLAGVLDGPEFRAEYQMTLGGRPECRLKIGYPRVGSGAAGLGVEVPGSALGYRAAWDSDQLRTWTFAVGDLPEDAPPGSERPTMLEQRFGLDLPRLDAVDDWPGTILRTTLRERANAMADTHLTPALELTATPPESYPPITRYGVGDDVTVRAVTPLLPDGLTVTGRLTQIDVNAAEGTAIWTVSTPSPPPAYREALTKRLDRIDTKVTSMFHSGPKWIDWQNPPPGADPQDPPPSQPPERRPE